MRRLTEAKLAKASDAKPRVLASSATLVRHEGPQDRRAASRSFEVIEEVAAWNVLQTETTYQITISVSVKPAPQWGLRVH